MPRSMAALLVQPKLLRLLHRLLMRSMRLTPGGSSSGSAAAVAAGMVPVALGTQTRGSVLRPASYCGVTGFKTSYGVLPMEGVLPLAKSLDTLGFFTHTPADMLRLWLTQL